MKRSALGLNVLVSLAALALAGCATESNRALEVQKTKSAVQAETYRGPRTTIFIGKFSNRSNYMRGMFSDGVDRLGGQAKTILMAHLNQSGRFDLVDRENLEDLSREAKLKSEGQAVAGADFAVTGDITEFGRKETGDKQLYGIAGAGKKQISYAKVTLNVVSVKTSRVVYSVQGAGEYELSSSEILGTGGDASYDTTLNGKVMDLAVREAVDRLAEGFETQKWQAER